MQIRKGMRRPATALTIVLSGALAAWLPSPAAGQSGHLRKVELAPSDHISVLRISPSERWPISRRIRIARNKSVVVHFPQDLRDVIVSAPDILDAVVQTSNQVFLIGKDKAGQTNAMFFGTSGALLLTLEVTIEQDVAELHDVFREMIPGSNIKVRIMNDTVLLSGTVPTPLASSRAADIASRFVAKSDSDERSRQKVVNMLAVEAEEQVMLRVTIAEIQRTALKQLGVNLGASINSGNFSTSVLTDNTLPLTSAQGLGKLATAAIDSTTGKLSNSSGSSFSNSGISSAFSAGGLQGTATLRAMERQGLVRTLAEPSLTAVSGEPAKFLAGGEFPITIVDSNGNTSVTFKEYGVGLSFTPVVLSEGRISLKIETEVSELTSDGAVTLSSISISPLKKRQAKTTVELPSGGSLALAGLISDSTRQNIDGVPGLKDIAVLGALFRSRDFVKSETELVVIVTPYVVRAKARNEFARPDDGFAPATDGNANFLGHLNRIYGRNAPLPPGGLKGDFGFIVD